MGEMLADTSPGLGFQMTKRPVRIVNLSGGNRLAGQVLMFLATSQVGHQNPPNFKQGDPTSAYVLASGPASATAVDGFGFVCVLMENILSQTEGMAWLWHPNVLVAVDGATTVGQPLTLTQTNGAFSLDASPATGARVAGIAHQAVAGVSCMAAFMGIIGFGKGGP